MLSIISKLKNIVDLRNYILIGDEIRKICKLNNIDISIKDLEKVTLHLVQAQKKVKLKNSRINNLKFIDQPYFKKELAWLFDDEDNFSLDEQDYK